MQQRCVGILQSMTARRTYRCGRAWRTRRRRYSQAIQTVVWEGRCYVWSVRRLLRPGRSKSSSRSRQSKHDLAHAALRRCVGDARRRWRHVEQLGPCRARSAGEIADIMLDPRRRAPGLGAGDGRARLVGAIERWRCAAPRPPAGSGRAAPRRRRRPHHRRSRIARRPGARANAASVSRRRAIAPPTQRAAPRRLAAPTISRWCARTAVEAQAHPRRRPADEAHLRGGFRHARTFARRVPHHLRRQWLRRASLWRRRSCDAMRRAHRRTSVA